MEDGLRAGERGPHRAPFGENAKKAVECEEVDRVERANVGEGGIASVGRRQVGVPYVAHLDHVDLARSPPHYRAARSPP